MSAMKNNNIVIEQLDDKLSLIKNAENVTVPDRGWVHGIRTTLNITLQRLSEKLNTSPQNIRAAEQREAAGVITLNSLREIAEAMDMKLVYGLVPKDESLEKLIEKRAHILAKKIVMRTSGSMKLENQENTAARLEKAIDQKTNEIIREMPKYLWD